MSATGRKEFEFDTKRNDDIMSKLYLVIDLPFGDFLMLSQNDSLISVHRG